MPLLGLKGLIREPEPEQEGNQGLLWVSGSQNKTLGFRV